VGRLRHNKKRTIGIVYEILVREVASAASSNDPKRAAAALDIISRHLSEGTELFEELSLHRSVMESRGVSGKLARRIVDELKAAGIKLGARKMLREEAKSRLIHEMNRTLGRDVFDRYRIPDYTAHASVGIILSRGLEARLDEAVDIARVEEHLVEFLKLSPTETKQYDPDATLYAYKTAVGLFEHEYGAQLTKEQADLLREYVRVSLGGNPAPFERTFIRQRDQLKESLKARRLDEVFTSDAEMASKLDEAIKDLDKMEAQADDEAVERLMLYHNLRKEIES